MKKIFRKKKNNSAQKIRSDKKIHVGPTLSIKLKTEVERLAYILDIPIKSLGEALCYEGLRYQPVVDLLSPYFAGDQHLKINNTLYIGHDDHETLTHYEGEKTDRISIRFTQSNYSDIKTLARLLDVTPSRAVAVLIDSAIRNAYIIEVLIRDYNRRRMMDDYLTAELKKFMKYIKKDNPYEDNTWGTRIERLVSAERNSTMMLETLDYKWPVANKK